MKTREVVSSLLAVFLAFPATLHATAKIGPRVVPVVSLPTGPGVPVRAPSPVVVSAVESGARLSSGLSQPSDAEISFAFRVARPQSQAENTIRTDFTASAADLILRHTFDGKLLDHLKSRTRRFSPRDRAMFQAAKDLIDAHDAADEPARHFIAILGRWSAFKDHAQEELRAARLASMRAWGQEPRQPKFLVPSPLAEGEYWDLASGMNASDFIYHELEPRVSYAFFDSSPFVSSYLRTSAELAGKPNVRVVEADILKLAGPQKPLAVLRAKNVANYVPDFPRKLSEMAGWIAPGGQLLIQNDPSPGQRSTIIKRHGPLINRLLSEGWSMDFGFSRMSGRFADYALDTLLLTRPMTVSLVDSTQVEKIWKNYRDAVSYMNTQFNLAALFDWD